MRQSRTPWGKFSGGTFLQRNKELDAIRAEARDEKLSVWNRGRVGSGRLVVAVDKQMLRRRYVDE